MKRRHCTTFLGRFFCLFLIAFSLFQSTAYAAASSYYDTVQRIYIGYYQRPADPAGLIYWAGRLDASGGSLAAIIESFANSAESQALYGTINSGNIPTVVNDLYKALFGRDAETAGRDYYVSGFNSGRFTVATIMLNVLYGVQNNDMQAVNNKVTAANLFSRMIDPELDGNNFQATYEGDGDAVAARHFLALYATSVRVPTQTEITAYVLANIADRDDVLSRQSSLGPIIACTAVAPPGVPVIDALTGQAPQPDPHKANPTRVVNVGPMTSDQFYPSGALTLGGRAHDPENGMIDFYWTWPDYIPVHERVPSDATVSEAFVPNPPRNKTYVAYLTAYDATSLFDQCQWNIVVGTNSAPKITVIADDLVIDFGRRDIWRRLFGPQPAVDALPESGSALAPSINPPGPITTRPFGNLCAYVGATPPPAQQTYLSTLPFGDAMDPIQYPGGMTCVYAIVGDANGDFLNAGFRIPEPVMGRGTLYAAIPVPNASEGGAQIVLVDEAPRNAPKTVADILPGGLVGGSILDTYEKIAAYNATLTYLANLGLLPVTGPLLTYTPILPLPSWPRGVFGRPQALPVIWEAPDDPDTRNDFRRNMGTHDCVTHRYELVALPRPDDYDPLCTIPAAGTVNIEGWVTDTHNPIQSGFTTVAYPDWEMEIPAAPILISPNGTINTSLATFLWKPVPTATHYQLAVNDSSANWVINKAYAASEAGCATGTCSLAPDTRLASGGATWFVAAWNPAGWGPWSAAMGFVVNDDTTKAWYGVEVYYSYKQGDTPCTIGAHKEVFGTRADADEALRFEAWNLGTILSGTDRTDVRIIRQGIYAGPQATKPTYTGDTRANCQ